MDNIFEATILNINSHKIVKIPLDISKKFSSRGLIMVKGTINNIPFMTPLEPDGRGSHWLEIDDLLCEKLNVTVGQNVTLAIEQTDDWIEPEVPSDILDTIITEGLLEQWNSLTVKARWEWFRWIRSTKNPETRKKRIRIACSKLQKGDRRPCCFNSGSCTITEVSKSGVLLD